MHGERRGVVLLAAILVLLALVTISSGLFVLGLQEVGIARAVEETLHARVAAESAVQAVTGEWSTSRYRSLEVGGRTRATPAPVTPGAGAAVVAWVERLAGRLFLVRADAELPSGTRATAAALVRGLGEDELWHAFPAAITLAGETVIEPAATVAGTDALEPPVPWTARECPDKAAALLHEVLGTTEPPAVLRTGPDHLDRLGPLDRRTLSRIADRYETGSLRPAPATRGGECDTAAPGNWGSPGDPAGPCGGYLPVIYAGGDLHLTGGEGQGLLVVAGNLVLSGDARFYGAVYVAGSVLLADDARVHGAVVAVGAEVRLADRSTVAYGACPLWRAFTAAPAFDRAFAPAERVWVPAP